MFGSLDDSQSSAFGFNLAHNRFDHIHKQVERFERIFTSNTLNFAKSYVDGKADAVYNWTLFDAWVTTAQADGRDVLYTFGGTPEWAAPSLVFANPK